MPSLYKRATPSQERILRIVEGAVLNAADGHRQSRDVWMARSIAKRAAGTLTAQWPEVLAASTRLPAKGTAQGNCRVCERREFLSLLRMRRDAAGLTGSRTERRASQLLRRPPLLVLWERIKRQMWHIVRDGDQTKIEAYRNVLRMIAALRLEIEQVR